MAKENEIFSIEINIVNNVHHACAAAVVVVVYNIL